MATFTLVYGHSSGLLEPFRLGQVFTDAERPINEEALASAMVTSLKPLVRARERDLRLPYGQRPDAIQAIDLLVETFAKLTPSILGLQIVGKSDKAVATVTTRVTSAIEIACCASALQHVLQPVEKSFLTARQVLEAELFDCQVAECKSTEALTENEVFKAATADYDAAVSHNLALARKVLALKARLVTMVVCDVLVAAAIAHCVAAVLASLFIALGLPSEAMERARKVKQLQRTVVHIPWTLKMIQADMSTITTYYGTWLASAEVINLADPAEVFLTTIIPAELVEKVASADEEARLTGSTTMLERLLDEKTRPHVLRWLDDKAVKLAGRRPHAAPILGDGATRGAQSSAPFAPRALACPHCPGQPHAKSHCKYYACYACGVPSAPGHIWSKCPNPRKAEYTYLEWTRLHPKTSGRQEFPPLNGAKLPKPALV